LTPRTVALAFSGSIWLTTGHPLFPGILASGVLAAAAAFLAQHYGASVMLLALLLGMAMNFLSDEGGCVPGIEFTARTLLRWASRCWACVALVSCRGRGGTRYQDAVARAGQYRIQTS